MVNVCNLSTHARSEILIGNWSKTIPIISLNIGILGHSFINSVSYSLSYYEVLPFYIARYRFVNLWWPP